MPETFHYFGHLVGMRFQVFRILLFKIRLILDFVEERKDSQSLPRPAIRQDFFLLQELRNDLPIIEQQLLCNR